MKADKISSCCGDTKRNECCDIEEQYSNVWPKYMEFEFKRSQHIIEMFGNLSTYLVLRVTIYHYFHLMKEIDTEIEGCCPFDNLLPENFEKFSDNFNLTKRINYSAIANFTGLDKETVRRIVAKLVKKEWLVLDAQNKIIFKPSAKNREMLTQLNSFEVNSLNVFVGRLHNN